MVPRTSKASPRSGQPDSTAVLLARARGGDNGAREKLVARYLPALQRIAHGRLPASARRLGDTGDLVQMTLVKALDRLDQFEHRREGAFLAYLRQILINQIRDEVRQGSKMMQPLELSDALVSSDPTPLQQAIGRQALEAYDVALSRLTSQHRQAVILRIEFGFNYAQVAEALGSPSPNAARLVVSRALVRLASLMRGLNDAG